MSRLSTEATSTLTSALNVLSTTLPDSTFLSLVRTTAPPLPGLWCWNHTTDHSCPSRLSTMPFLRSLVVATREYLPRSCAVGRFYRPAPRAPRSGMARVRGYDAGGRFHHAPRDHPRGDHRGRVGLDRAGQEGAAHGPDPVQVADAEIVAASGAGAGPGQPAAAGDPADARHPAVPTTGVPARAGVRAAADDTS